VIEIKTLHKSFGDNHVLKGVSLEIREGEVVALIGRSGCGKSVLLRHLTGLMLPDEGGVVVDGNDMNALRGGQLISWRDRLGFLFQGGALFDSMTLFENVAFPLREKTRLSDERIHDRVLQELEHVGLSGAENKYPAQLSGGMKKRAALARALVMDPEIMLFDEPTTGLDPIIGFSILKLLHGCHERLSFTGIIASHDVPRIFDIVNRVVMLHEGVVWAEGSPDEFRSLDDPVVLRFLGEHREEG
jgi:phospholipid/cholesterol/gamma-HCH transport system ATP-binding protein